MLTLSILGLCLLAGASAHGDHEMAKGFNPNLLIHGILMLVAWIIFATTGIFQARYMKIIDRRWFIWHALSQVLTLALTTVGIVLAWISYEGRLEIGLHQICGVFVFASCWLQAFLGIISHFCYNKHRSEAPIFPDRLHWWLGRITYVAAVVTILLGLWHISYGMAPWLLLLLWIIATIGTFIYHDIAIGQSHEYSSLSETKPAHVIDWSVLRVYKIVSIVVVLGVIAHIADANNPANFETGGTMADNHSHSH